MDQKISVELTQVQAEFLTRFFDDITKETRPVSFFCRIIRYFSLSDWVAMQDFLSILKTAQGIRTIPEADENQLPLGL